jgi:hypothetical protein
MYGNPLTVLTLTLSILVLLGAPVQGHLHSIGADAYLGETPPGPTPRLFAAGVIVSSCFCRLA